MLVLTESVHQLLLAEHLILLAGPRAVVEVVVMMRRKRRMSRADQQVVQ